MRGRRRLQPSCFLDEYEPAEKRERLAALDPRLVAIARRHYPVATALGVHVHRGAALEEVLPKVHAALLVMLGREGETDRRPWPREREAQLGLLEDLEARRAALVAARMAEPMPTADPGPTTSGWRGRAEER